MLTKKTIWDELRKINLIYRPSYTPDELKIIGQAWWSDFNQALEVPFLKAIADYRTTGPPYFPKPSDIIKRYDFIVAAIPQNTARALPMPEITEEDRQYNIKKLQEIKKLIGGIGNGGK